jgi:hypothetical protein
VRRTFNYTEAMTRLIERVVVTMPAFAHVDTERIVVACSQARADTRHGMLAKVVPLRFEGGAPTMRRNGRVYTLQRVVREGREMLYLVVFYLPRYQNLEYRQKLLTLFHELYHISPHFDGDCRRFPGRDYKHGRSREAYDRLVEPFIDEFQHLPGAGTLAEFLESDFLTLQQTRGQVVGTFVPMPRLIPVTEETR